MVGKILRRHRDDRLAGIAAFRQQALGRIDIAWALENLAAFFSVERRPRREEARQRLPHVVVADIGAHVVGLIHRHEDRPARAHIVEGRK